MLLSFPFNCFIFLSILKLPLFPNTYDYIRMFVPDCRLSQNAAMSENDKPTTDSLQLLYAGA